MDPATLLGPKENALLAFIPTIFNSTLRAADPVFAGSKLIGSSSGAGFNIEGRSGGFDYFEFYGLLKLTRIEYQAPSGATLDKQSLFFWAAHLAPVFRPFKDRYLTISLGGGLVNEPVVKSLGGTSLAIDTVALPMAEFIVNWRFLEGASASLGIEAGIEYLFYSNAAFVKYRNGLGLNAKIIARVATSFGEIYLAPVYRYRESTTTEMVSKRDEAAMELGFAFTL